MSTNGPASSLQTVLALAASLWLGLLSWIPPVVTFWFLAMLSGRERWIGGREMFAGALVAALLTMGVPLGLLAWYRWRRAAIAFGVGIAIGAIPTVWVVVTFLALAAR